jgi:glycine/D-amino acid oxidase-like deaminating enzyme
MQNGHHIDSWYAASVNKDLNFPPREGEIEADICIVGGGYTGLSSAIHLRDKGYSVAVIEAEHVGWGASGRNGGHCSTGQRADQAELESMTSSRRYFAGALDTGSRHLHPLNYALGLAQAAADGGARIFEHSRVSHYDKGNTVSVHTDRGVVKARHMILAEAIAGTAERFDVIASIPTPTFPGGTLLRWPGLVLAMAWYAMLDRI